jgi:hypothetical protein
VNAVLPTGPKAVTAAMVPRPTVPSVNTGNGNGNIRGPGRAAAGDGPGVNAVLPTGPKAVTAAMVPQPTGSSINTGNRNGDGNSPDPCRAELGARGTTGGQR